MRKLLFMVLVLSFIFSTQSAMAVASSNSSFIDEALLEKGVLGIIYEAPKGKTTKLMVVKEGKRYTYDINSSKEVETFSLQSGNGTYEIYILENTTGNSYKVVKSDRVTLDMKNSNEVFLNSVQNVNWNESMLAIKKAKELTKNAKTDEDKVKIIYNYIINSVKYDKQKANVVQAGYLPNINDTFSTNQAICYDYSALFASMLRSLDIPAKLVMGDTTWVNEYHAWNEVYLEGKGGWVTIDTTVDAGLQNSNKSYSMIKDNSDYQVANIY